MLPPDMDLNHALPLVFLKTKGFSFYANHIEVVDVLLPASAYKWGSLGRAVFDTESFFEGIRKLEQLLLGKSKKFGEQKLQKSR